MVWVILVGAWSVYRERPRFRLGEIERRFVGQTIFLILHVANPRHTDLQVESCEVLSPSGATCNNWGLPLDCKAEGEASSTLRIDGVSATASTVRLSLDVVVPTTSRRKRHVVERALALPGEETV